MLSLAAIALACLSAASAQSVSVPNTSTASAAVAKERATAVPLSPQSHVEGKVFNRFVNIMMENTDFTIAQQDRKLPAIHTRAQVRI
jgi:acid phosphatase